MKRIYFRDFDQNGLEWLAIRSGMVTASEVKALFTPKMAVKKGEAVETLIAQKLAERWVGGSLPSVQTHDMEYGKMREELAWKWYEFTFDKEVDRCAFIAREDMQVGCSPDGLIGTDGGLEIKCPQPTNHVKYLLDGNVPEEYMPQVQYQIYASGRQWWQFISFRPEFPKLVVRVERDEKMMELIDEAVSDLLVRINKNYDILVNLYGRSPHQNPFRQSLIEKALKPVPSKQYTMGNDIVP